MSPTPTSPERSVRLGSSRTLVEALDFAALGDTGINTHSLRGELVEAIPYAGLSREARTIALRLLAAGLRPGDRVGLAAETDGDFVRSFFACQYAGLIAAPLPLPAPLGGKAGYVEQITRMLRAAGAMAMLGPAAVTGWLREADHGLDLRFAGSLSELPQAGAAGELPPPQPDDPAYLQFSSGSTRFPKGVTITHRAVMANAEAITRHGLRVTAADRAVSWLPLYHDMGLVGFLLSPLASQMSVDLLPTGAFVRRPLLWLELMTRNGGTIAYSPTFGYELCARRGETAPLDGLDLSRWRVAGVGGDMIRTAPLNLFAARFSERGFRPKAYVASYGMAEATLALTMAPLDRGLEADTLDVDRLERSGAAVPAEAGRHARAFARCGVALPGHQIQVRVAAGEAAAGQVGRVFARGPSVMTGYWGDPEETDRTLSADGWLDTGDLGYLAGGELVLTGRAKDLIIVNGRNIWPQDLEWSAETDVAGLRSGDVAVIAIPGADEDAVVALVQSRQSDPGQRLRLAEDVKALLRTRHSVEAVVELVGAHALPRTSSGKLSRAAARRLYLEGALTRAPETV